VGSPVTMGAVGETILFRLMHTYGNELPDWINAIYFWLAVRFGSSRLDFCVPYTHRLLLRRRAGAGREGQMASCMPVV